MSHDSHHGHHIIPLKVLVTVFAALVVLTVVTVLTAKFVDLGPLNLPLAIAIATTKAGLVVAFFMALKYDNKVNTLAFAIGTMFVIVFLTFTLFDTAFRDYAGNSVDGDTILDQQAREEVIRQREPDPADLRVTPADYAQDAETTEDGE